MAEETTGIPSVSRFDVAVIGGGVVGCGVLRALTLRGLRCILLEREDALASSWSSAGNTGIACTAADCTPGTLEHRLLASATKLNSEAYERMRIPHRRTGALYVAWTAAEAEGPLRELAAAHGLDASDEREHHENEAARLLTGSDAIAAVVGAVVGGGGGGGGSGSEAAVGSPAQEPHSALHVKGEITVEPWLVPIAWATQAMVNGAIVKLSTAVVGTTFIGEDKGKAPEGVGWWRIALRATGDDVDQLDTGAAREQSVVARVVVNCGGLWADDVEQVRMRGLVSDREATAATGGSDMGAEEECFQILPRRGDYLIFGSDEIIAQASPSPSSSRGGGSGGNGVLPLPWLPLGGMPLTAGPVKAGKGELHSGGGGRGPYVWRTCHGDLVVGPTSQDLPAAAKNGNAHLWHSTLPGFPGFFPGGGGPPEHTPLSAFAATCSPPQTPPLPPHRVLRAVTGPGSGGTATALSLNSAAAAQGGEDVGGGGGGGEMHLSSELQNETVGSSPIMSGLGDPPVEMEHLLKSYAAKYFPLSFEPPTTHISNAPSHAAPAAAAAVAAAGDDTVPTRPSSKLSIKDTYSGLRPCLSSGKITSSSDYMIEYSGVTKGRGSGQNRPQWAVVAGIRSTGLTASLAIGEHVASLICKDANQTGRGDSPPQSTSSMASSNSVPSNIFGGRGIGVDEVIWPLLPTLGELCASFADRNDGCVDVVCYHSDNSNSSSGCCAETVSSTSAATATGATRGSILHSMTHRVTHPQTRYGLSTRPPFLEIASAACLRPLREAIESIIDDDTMCATDERSRSREQPIESQSEVGAPTTSPLAFLARAVEASVLRGGLTNALYLVRVPPARDDFLRSDRGQEAKSRRFFGDCAGLWVVRKSAAPAEDTTAADRTTDQKNWEATTNQQNNESVDVMHRVHRICRVCEHRCVGAAWAAGLTPRAFFDPQKNLLAQSYIAEPETFNSRSVSVHLDECVDLLKVLHENVSPAAFDRCPSVHKNGGGHLDGHIFDVFETAEHYLTEIRRDAAVKHERESNPAQGSKSKHDLSGTNWEGELPADIGDLFGHGRRLSKALQKGMSTTGKWHPVPCHNDLVVGNFVRGRVDDSNGVPASAASIDASKQTCAPSGREWKRRLYLIDFEYSALGDRCFDLANLCINSDLTRAQVDRVVRRYFTEDPLPEMSEKIISEHGDATDENKKMLLEVLVAEGRARVELLKLLSDLREGLWSYAHGLCVEEQQRRQRMSKSALEGDQDDSSVLPPSFYKEYGRKHLDRFRRNLRVNASNIEAWVKCITEASDF